MVRTLRYVKYECVTCAEIFDDEATCILHERKAHIQMVDLDTEPATPDAPQPPIIDLSADDEDEPIEPDVKATRPDAQATRPDAQATRPDVQATHQPPVRKYYCPTCGLPFSCRENLTSHIRTHNAEALLMAATVTQAGGIRRDSSTQHGKVRKPKQRAYKTLPTVPRHKLGKPRVPTTQYGKARMPSTQNSADVCNICNREEDECAGSNPRVLWIACDLCEKWVHRSCANIPPKAKDFICSLH